MTGFGPGKSFSVDLDIDRDGFDSGENYQSVFFNNGVANNSIVTLWSGPKYVNLVLPDNPVQSAPGVYTFKGPNHQLKVRSIAETNGTDFVRVVQVKVNGQDPPLKMNIGELETFELPTGTQVEISAPRQVYKDINGRDITNSVDIEPALVDEEAEERFTALGISVNNVPQTGDPTLYRFEMTGDTQVEVKWQQEYALTIKSDFANTQSTTTLNGQPLAGPLTSQAAGNPSPAAQKHWIKRGEPAIAAVDGNVIDQLAQPGLDIRYVVKGYRAYGPPNNNTSVTLDLDRLPQLDGGKLEPNYGFPVPITGWDAGPAPGGGTRLTIVGHGLSTGVRVRITDASQDAFNGDWEITRIDADHFTIPKAFTAGLANGKALRLVDIREPRSGTITSYASGGASKTLVTSAGHGLKSNATIVIKNSLTAAYNGSFIVTRVGPDTFTIPVAFTTNPALKGSWLETTYVDEFAFNPSMVETRQQVEPFNMWGPAGITYEWQIQYGVRVNVDDVTRKSLPKIVQVNGPGSEETIGVQDGLFWFDPGVHLKVLSAAKEDGPSGRALNGWISGDGFYFPSNGTIDPISGNLLSTGQPGAGSLWIAGGSTAIDRGLEIIQLNRPARVMWRYGSGAFAVNVTIGEYLFEHDDTLASTITREPQAIDASTFSLDPLIQLNGVPAPAAADIATWDPVAGRLYPLLPGTFTVPWKPGTVDTNPVDIVVTAVLPNDTERGIRGHYPHIVDTPPVALDPDGADNFTFKTRKFTNAGGVVDGANLFTATRPGFTVLLFSEIQRTGHGPPREFLRVRVVHSKAFDTGLPAAIPVKVGTRIQAGPTVDRAKLGTGYIRNSSGPVRYNPFIYDVGKLSGLAAKDIYDMDLLRSNPGQLVVVDKSRLPGPVFPVNAHPNANTSERLTVVWYDDPARNDTLLWPHQVRAYEASYPDATDTKVDRIVIASQYGNEGKAASTSTNQTSTGEQIIAPAVLPDFPNPATTYDPSRLQSVQIYQQPDKTKPGYNPNEEHALIAPSLRFADVSPRPPAVYALRNNDLNTTALGDAYTSDPFVLAQFFDVATQEYGMKLYRVQAEDAGRGYKFAIIPQSAALATTLNNQGHVEMEAGEPVIPFYPLGVAIGAAIPEEVFGNNLPVAKPTGGNTLQLTYWEDHKGSTWAVSGGTNAWFTTSFYYPLAPDFYWPPNRPVPPVKVTSVGAVNTPGYDADKTAKVPRTGDAVSFMPRDSSKSANNNAADFEFHLPKPILYHSNWPVNPPVLKAGETLTFSGGENRADNPTHQIVKSDGTVETVETPGLPQVLAFASAEVVFDSLNPETQETQWKDYWTARVVQALDVRRIAFPITNFSTDVQPATGKTRLSQGKYVFNDLPASLQKRFRYDPLAQRLEFSGFVNDKDIGDNTLTAAPPAVYVLEPNILTAGDVAALKALVTSDHKTEWDGAIDGLALLTLDPNTVSTETSDPFVNKRYLVGLSKSGENSKPARSFGPGLALVPNDGFLNPSGTLADGSDYPAEGWITVVENNDPSLGGSPITPHVIKVDRKKRYRGSIKTILSDNVFDENIVLRHTGDFGTKAGDLYFEWYYRPDDGSLNVPPPDQLRPGEVNPWKLFPDPSGAQGLGRYQITLKGNPNAPETLLADSWWFVRYRHKNDTANGSNWAPNTTQPTGTKKYEWAGAGNSDPFHDFDLDGVPDYRAQLASGWIKRVLDAVNPYEARIRDFEGENPTTQVSMISQFGPRFEGPVALNPAKDVIENVGLIELYETILKRGRDLSIDLSRPVSTPAIANALQLASTRLSDFYTLLGNEAYGDAQDPTIGFGSDSVDYGSLAPAVFAFQNQQPDLIGEELGLLRGVDDFFARPVYNRLFWNFTKGEGEAAYAMNYNISDVNMDGFIDEDDAMIMYPQGHGDAWGHYLTALTHQYALLKHPYFNWVSRSESYNLQDIVITVDFLDERKFAATAAAKAKAGAEIVNLTYRDKFVEAPDAQWQGYTDTNPDRAWGVDEWARRAGQGAYFDWVTANALLPSEHPNTTLEGVRKVDRENNADIPVISANLAAIQGTMDRSNRGQNPLGISRNGLVFDIDPTFLEVGSTAQIGTRAVQGLLHFDQIYERALKMLENAKAIWDNANEPRNMLRQVGNSEAEFRNSTFQEDLSYRNQLIQIFGKPYEGTVGPGKIYPAGYTGPDLALFMYVPVRQINKSTVPGPSSSWASFTDGALSSGDLYDAFRKGSSSSGAGTGTGTFANNLESVSSDVRALFTSTFSSASNYYYTDSTTSGLFAVNYTDLQSPKINLTNYIVQLPVTAAGYTFQAPSEWGTRAATGELQSLITQMLVQEAAVAESVGAWDSLSGEIVRIIRLINARLTTTGRLQVKEEVFSRIKLAVTDTIKGIEAGMRLANAVSDTVLKITDATSDAIPGVLPTAGLAFSPGDALSAAASGVEFAGYSTFTGLKAAEEILALGKTVAEISLDAVENELNLDTKREERDLQIKEWLKELEDKIGDEPIRRIQIFKEIQTLADLSNQYRSKVDEGTRLIDERAAFNKRVAAQTQRNRYQDMTFRVARNHALQSYRSAFDLAARYSWLAAKAYDYETNYDPSDPGSAQGAFSEIMRARSIGNFDETPRQGAGGLSEALAKLKANYESQRGQLGLNTPQRETGKMSLRTELMRILPKGSLQPVAGAPAGEFPAPGMDSDSVWKAELAKAKVPDLWDVPEFRYYCRPFADPADANGAHVPQPGIVIRFGSEVTAGKNFFGKPLSGGDHAYDPTNYTTKIVGVGVWFSDYLSDDVLNDLASAPRVYLVPAGTDIMRVPHSGSPDTVRMWNVLDQVIPVPVPTLDAGISNSRFIPILDTLNGPTGEVRRFSSFRAYHNGEADIDFDELVTDSRLIGRSIWNTQWVLIIPGQALNADPEEGLTRFMDQVSDIQMVFETYGVSGG
ncbi:MAG TPA: hypothetical protein VHM91_16550 [Verrucomicrobiales bacterium]|nr:hypothetical protein [Verrucomicrobiales bacterium]